MKRIIAAVCLLVLLAGCSGKHEEMDRAMALRSKLLAQGAAFDAEITADYGKELYTFPGFGRMPRRRANSDTVTNS